MKINIMVKKLLGIAIIQEIEIGIEILKNNLPLDKLVHECSKMRK